MLAVICNFFETHRNDICAINEKGLLESWVWLVLFCPELNRYTALWPSPDGRE
jgi:hypothetical protein